MNAPDLLSPMAIPATGRDHSCERPPPRPACVRRLLPGDALSLGELGADILGMAPLHPTGPLTGATCGKHRTAAGGPLRRHAGHVTEHDLTGHGRTVAEPAMAQSGASELICGEIVAELDQLEGVTVSELLSLYFDEAFQQMAELSSAIAQGDAATVGRTAHRLRGSSSTLGAARVAQLAAELEASARANDLAVAGGLLASLRSGLQDTRQAFGRNRAIAATTPTEASSITQTGSDRLPAPSEETR